MFRPEYGIPSSTAALNIPLPEAILSSHFSTSALQRASNALASGHPLSVTEVLIASSAGMRIIPLSQHPKEQELDSPQDSISEKKEEENSLFGNNSLNIVTPQPTSVSSFTSSSSAPSRPHSSSSENSSQSAQFVTGNFISFFCGEFYNYPSRVLLPNGVSRPAPSPFPPSLHTELNSNTSSNRETYDKLHSTLLQKKKHDLKKMNNIALSFPQDGLDMSPFLVYTNQISSFGNSRLRTPSILSQQESDYPFDSTFAFLHPHCLYDLACFISYERARSDTSKERRKYRKYKEERRYVAYIRANLIDSSRTLHNQQSDQSSAKEEQHTSNYENTESALFNSLKDFLKKKSHSQDFTKEDASENNNNVKTTESNPEEQKQNSSIPTLSTLWFRIEDEKITLIDFNKIDTRYVITLFYTRRTFPVQDNPLSLEAQHELDSALANAILPPFSTDKAHKNTTENFINKPVSTVTSLSHEIPLIHNQQKSKNLKTPLTHGISTFKQNANNYLQRNPSNTQSHSSSKNNS